MRDKPFSPLEHLDDKDYFTKARKLEKKLAKRLGGRTQPASGATPFAKGDIKLKNLLVEVKQTGKSRFTLTLKLFKKIRREAQEERKTPMMILEIQGEKFVVMDYTDVFERGFEDDGRDTDK